jgi:hypothetical protein
VKALFNPNVKYQGLIQVQSELTPACGIWKVIKLDLDLESGVPHAKWFLTANARTAKRDAGPMSGRPTDRLRRPDRSAASLPRNGQAN